MTTIDTTAIVPFACDISRLDREARMREQTLLAWFQETYADAVWSDDGYRFTIAADRTSLGNLGELLALERLCCPFLQFRLEVDRDETAALKITGRDGVREFIAMTFARP
jgi:hypothetical protein